jgi:hypothetical protein
MKREPVLQPIELLQELGDHAVDFVVIGGFSLAAHGYVRGTKDLDIVPEPSRQNLARLAAALVALGAERLETGDSRPEELELQPDLDGLALGGNWTLRTRLGRLAVMQDVPGMSGYERLRAGAVAHQVPGLSFAPAFAGLDDLIALKRAAGRDQDLLDIAELERARGAGP